MIQNRRQLMDAVESPALQTLRGDALAILEAGLAAVSPEQALTQHLEREGHRLDVDDLRLDLGEFEAVRLLAAGKASVAMARTFLRIVGVQEGLVVTHTEERVDDPRLETLLGGHPIPDQGSLRAGERALELADRCGPKDLLVVLLSGGGSALLEASDLPLEALQETTRILLRSGMDIRGMNTVRKHLSRIKGGRLGKRALARGSRVVTLAMSDVVGDPPPFIASGPTVPDPTTFQDAVGVLRRHAVWDALPAEAREPLEAGLRDEAEETPKPGDPAFERASYRVVASVSETCRAAAREARERGYEALFVTPRLQGEAREVAKVLAGMALAVDEEDIPVPKPGVLALGGETTVTVRGEGRGGRNQELVLAALPALAGRRLVLLSCNTDGRDGATDVAGALADGESLRRAEDLGLDPEAFLEDNDSHGFFRALGDALRTGPTGTNVMDLVLILAGPPDAD